MTPSGPRSASAAAFPGCPDDAACWECVLLSFICLLWQSSFFCLGCLKWSDNHAGTLFCQSQPWRSSLVLPSSTAGMFLLGVRPRALLFWPRWPAQLCYSGCQKRNHDGGASSYNARVPHFVHFVQLDLSLSGCSTVCFTRCCVWLFVARCISWWVPRHSHSACKMLLDFFFSCLLASIEIPLVVFGIDRLVCSRLFRGV